MIGNLNSKCSFLTPCCPGGHAFHPLKSTYTFFIHYLHYKHRATFTDNVLIQVISFILIKWVSYNIPPKWQPETKPMTKLHTLRFKYPHNCQMFQWFAHSLLSFFPLWWKKKSMSYFVKKTVCLHLFPTKNSFNLQRQKIPPILSNDMHFFPHYKS